MDKTDKLNEVIAFIKTNPGKSNNWYATNNGVVSRATFFRLLGEIETAVSKNETANETAVSKNETANETAEKEWWEEDEQETDNLYFENDDPQTRREKKRIADNEVRRAQQIVAERKRREANGEFPDYAECKVFLDKFFSFEKTRAMSMHDILKILRQRRSPRPEWLARYMSENGIDNRNSTDIKNDIDKENGILDSEKRDLERTEYLSTHEDSLENRVEYLMSFVKMEERFDNSKVREAIRKAVKDNCPDKTLEQMTANPDGCRSFVSGIVNMNRSKINRG